MASSEDGSGMRIKNAAGFRAPEPGPSERAGPDPGPGTTDPAEAKRLEADEDITGQFHTALDVLEETYDTCRRQAEAGLRKIRKR